MDNQTERQTFERLKQILTKKTSRVLYTETKKVWQEGYGSWGVEHDDVIEYIPVYSSKERKSALEELKTLKETCLDEIVGNRVIVKVVKNKLAAPFKKTEFDIYFNEGISRETDVINFAMKNGVIKKTGLTYQFGQEKLGVGMDVVRLYLKENPDKVAEIIDKIKNNEKNKKVSKGETPSKT